MDRGAAAGPRADGRRLIRLPMLRRLFVAAFWAALLFAVVMALVPVPPPVPGNPSDKVQHMVAFAVLTTLALAAYPRTNAAGIAIALFALGGLIEVAQLIPALGREGSWLDFAADCAAVLATMALGVPLRRWLLRQPRWAAT